MNNLWKDHEWFIESLDRISKELIKLEKRNRPKKIRQSRRKVSVMTNTGLTHISFPVISFECTVAGDKLSITFPYPGCWDFWWHCARATR